MRALTPSEQRLVFILAGVLFIVANVIFLPMLSRRQTSVSRDISQLRAESLGASGWLNNIEYWRARDAWLNQNQPVLGSVGDASVTFLESLQTSLRGAGLTITDQSLLSSESSELSDSIGARITVKGQLVDLAKWLASMQIPEQFIQVPEIQIRSDDPPPAVICSLTVRKLYRQSRTPVPPSP